MSGLNFPIESAVSEMPSDSRDTLTTALEHMQVRDRWEWYAWSSVSAPLVAQGLQGLHLMTLMSGLLVYDPCAYAVLRCTITLWKDVSGSAPRTCAAKHWVQRRSRCGHDCTVMCPCSTSKGRENSFCLLHSFLLQFIQLHFVFVESCAWCGDVEALKGAWGVHDTYL